MMHDSIGGTAAGFRALLCLAAVALPLFAQNGVSNSYGPRGLVPFGSYSLSDLESIDNVYGGLTFKVPLASLPAGRAGFSLGIPLVYNSNVYDASGGGLALSPFGGWNYGYEYGLNMIQDPNAQSSCAAGGKPFQMSAIFPDGSSHLLHLYGGVDTGGDGFYGYLPGLCAPTIGSGLDQNFTYYTDDGTYVKVVIQKNTGSSCTPGLWDCWTDHPWTMYFKDGMQVAGIGPQALSVSDRNGNTIQIRNVDSLNDPSSNPTQYWTGPATMLQDALGRTIVISRSGASSSPVDTITQTGVNGVTLTWTVYWETVGSSSTGVSQTVVQKIVFPANTSGYAPTYQFAYDSTHWNQLTSVTLPTGATVAYTYVNSSTIASPPRNPITAKVVTWCDESDVATPVQSVSGCSQSQRTDNWTYTYSGTTSSTVTGPDGGQTKYQFNDTSTNSGFSLGGGLVYKITEPDGSVIDRFWAWNPPYEPSANGGNSPQNPFIAWQFRSVATNGAVTTSSPMSGESVFPLDRNGNIVQQYELDWQTRAALPSTGMPTLGQFTTLRTTTQAMQTPAPTYNNPTQDDANGYWYPTLTPVKTLNLPACRSTSGAGNGTMTEFTYSADGNVLQQLDWDSTLQTSQQVCAIPAATMMTGPAGAYSPVLNSSSATAHTQSFDAFGNVTDSHDGKGNDNHTAYDANSLYPVTTYDAYGSALQRSTSYSFDFNSGLLLSTTDYNGLTRALTYDNLGRTVQIVESGSGNGSSTTLRKTSTIIDDANRRVATVSDLASPADQQMGSVVLYDQLGRQRLTRQMEAAPTGWTLSNLAGNLADDTLGIKVQTRYAWGPSGASYKLVSNPYRATVSSAEPHGTMGWTLTTSVNGAGGRSVTVATYTDAAPPLPFGSSNPPTTGSVVTTYAASSSPLGETSTVTDQANTSRTTLFDGLGRTEEVTENGLYLPSPNSTILACTAYLYDVQDNMTGVVPASTTSCGVNSTTQLAQPGTSNRSLAYDSLGRLSSAANPESGTVGYKYDSNSNLIQRTDALNRVTCFGTWSSSGCDWQGYDALNRLTLKSYSDGVTPAVAYTYAGPSQTQDFLASVSSTASSYTYSGYDALGRPSATQQTTKGMTFPFTGITWGPQGDMETITYPSGRTITATFNNADRPLTVTGNLGGTTTNYTSGAGAQYAAHGGLSQLVTGEGVTRSVGYNDRLQVSSVLATASSGTLLSLGYAYGTASTANNGNLASETIARSGFSASQSYGYDNVNRLTSASEGSNWSQGYVFDVIGNRAVGSGYVPVNSSSFTPQTSNSTVPYDTHNHWVGAGYDAAGNMTSLVTQALTYDAESRLLTLADGNVTDSFTYDGDGKRVTKTYNNVVTTYVYDPNGQLAMEVGGGTPAVTGTLYPTTDRLGSTRLTTAAGASVVACHDYLPFGEEIPGAVRSGVGCYSQAAETDVKYTGQLFDAETGLAYFNARYLRASMGSYVSADEPLNDQWQDDPQSWKLDSYVRNNPLKGIDPSGMDCINTDNYESGGQYTITTGNCDGGSGTYVDGTVTGVSISGSTLSYNFTPYSDPSIIGTGSIQGLPDICDIPALCGAANRAGIEQIAALSGPVETLGDVLVTFVAAMIGVEPGSPETFDVGKDWEPPAERGRSTGRTEPRNLKEQLAMQQVKANPANGLPVRLKKGMTDSRWPASQGWVKMSRNVNGVEIHWVRNTLSGVAEDFKFIN